ncbi:hypothetical protein [Martelella limonii]|uniref:hypothetical protein n=1 Tax=Martelella limonii TaxID=1647649 RepID=UPI00158001AA|nr:hypothetical protein [Martelella limonii]
MSSIDRSDLQPMARERESHAESEAVRERSVARPRFARRPAATASERERLQTAIETIAALMIDDPVYLPIFERLEREIELERNRADTMARARAVLRQKEMVPAKP